MAANDLRKRFYIGDIVECPHGQLAVVTKVLKGKVFGIAFNGDCNWKSISPTRKNSCMNHFIESRVNQINDEFSELAEAVLDKLMDCR